MTLESIAESIFQAAAEALGVGARLVEAGAKRHAPVRSVFAGTPQPHIEGHEQEDEDDPSTRYAIYNDYMRPINIGETMSKRTALVKAGRPAQWDTTSQNEHAPVWWRQRRLGNLQSMASSGLVEPKRNIIDEPMKDMLSKRGAYEVRSMRAAWSTWGHVHIGGRLRGEIYSLSPSINGHRAEAWVISPTPYAKFQEFGTRHNAAHPYLRPAAEESRDEVIGLIRAAVAEAARTSGSKAAIEIVVRI